MNLKKKKIKLKPKKELDLNIFIEQIVNAFNMGLLFSVRKKALGYHSQNTAFVQVCAMNWLY